MKIHEILAEIDLAYPLDIFPDTTQAERDQIVAQYPGFIDRTSAMMGRHLAQVITDKLATVTDDDEMSAMMAYRRCRQMLSKEHCENTLLTKHLYDATKANVEVGKLNADLQVLVDEMAVALECASVVNTLQNVAGKKDGGLAWGNPSPFQDVINGLLKRAGREPK